MKEPTVSLCMIVKDEEQMLPRCLASVKDYVDEIVVVDTGSSDRTVEIAKSFGAKVYHHPWEDNFSKHRNQSIGYATGRWFMYLDADEEIVKGTGSVIRKAIQNETVDSVTFEFISLYSGGKKSFHTQQRLFRNDRGIHFEGRIHNRIVGVKTTCLYPIKVLHHGYDVDVEKAKLKHERRLTILRREIDDDPQNPIHHHYLAASLLSAPDYEQAAREALQAVELADMKGEAGNPFYAWTHYIAATALFHSGRVDEAQRFCHLGLKRFPDDLDLYFMACLIAFKQKDSASLERYASKYLALHADMTSKPEKGKMTHCVTFDQVWRIWWFLAMDRNRNGRKEDFERHLHEAMGLAPKRSDAYYATARYFMENRDLDRARTELSNAFAEDPNNADIIYSHIELFIRSGDAESEIHWWKELLNRFPDKEPDMVKEANRAICEKRFEEARKLLAVLLNHRPNDSELLFSLAYVLLKQKKYEEAEAYYIKGSQIKKDSLEVLLGLAKISWMEGNIEKCVTICDQILKKLGLPRDIVLNSVAELGSLYWKIGESLIKKNDHLSKIAFEIAIEMNGRPSDALKDIADIS